MANVLILFQMLGELVSRETAFILDFAVRLPRGLYGGLRWGLASAGASTSIASVTSGYIVTGLFLGLVWLVASAIRKYRIRSPGPIGLLAGKILFWLGIAMGAYFLGLAFAELPRRTLSDQDLYLLAGTAVFYPALGGVVRYLLGG
jgi:hypothetical protein